MKLRRDEQDEVLIFEEIEPFFVDLLRRIPSSADPGKNSAANGRLFSDPLREDVDGFNADWREYVQPEIKDLFLSANAIVKEDLSGLPEASSDVETEDFVFDPEAFAPASHTFSLPRLHIDPWLTTLNRARLVIAAKQGFGEREMDEDIHFPPLTSREFGKFQLHFYDYLQQILMRELGFD